MVDTDDIVQIQVPVPRTRLPEFYEWFAQWLKADVDSSDLHLLQRSFVADELVGHRQSAKAKKHQVPLWESRVVFKHHDTDDEATTREVQRPWISMDPKLKQGDWDGDALADAINVYDKLSYGAKLIVDVLLNSSGEQVSGESLARELNLSQAQLTGTLASVGLRSKAVRREVPFRYKSDAEGGRYWMEPDVAALFIWARAQPPEIVDAAAKYQDFRTRYWDFEDMMTRMRSDLGDPGHGYGGLEIGNDVFLGVEEAAYRLERAHRSDLGQPESEMPQWLNSERRRLSRSEENKKKEAWMS